MLNNPKIPTGVELTLVIPRYPSRTFADRLRQYRRERGWRQVDFARVIGVNKDTVRNWEIGRSVPRLAALGRRAVAFVKALRWAPEEPSGNGGTPGV